MSDKYSRSEYEVSISLDIDDVMRMNYAVEDLASGFEDGVLSNSLMGIISSDNLKKQERQSRDWLDQNYTARSGAMKIAGCVCQVTALYLEALETRRVIENNKGA